MKHNLIQYRFFRKMFPDLYYYVEFNLPMAPFWVTAEDYHLIGYSQKRIIKIHIVY